MSRVGFAGLQPAPGERASGMVPVPGVDPPWEMPAVVVRGRDEGPTLAMIAGLHAAEYVPIEASVRFARGLDPEALRGTVISIPVVNTPGFYERTAYVNPRDGRNLNRQFPGDAEGAPSERVASFLTTELIEGSDAFLDLHCGDLVEALVPFCLYQSTGHPVVADRSRALAEAYGFGYLIAADRDTVPGASYAAAVARGVPAIIAEAGQQGIYEQDPVGRHVRGLRNVLVHLGMSEGEVDRGTPPTELMGFSWLRTDTSCTWHPTVGVGDAVVQGEPVGELHDLFGERLQVMEAPASGWVLFLVTALAVRAGDPLMGIGVAEPAPRARSGA